jgi:hypothetical protein
MKPSARHVDAASFCMLPARQIGRLIKASTRDEEVADARFGILTTGQGMSA